MAGAPTSTRCFAFVALCGATIAPVGDHVHVACGVTEYLTDFGPIWLGNSPLWFVVVVATFMASLAVVQGRLQRTDGPAESATVFAAPLSILGLYLTTSLYPWREGGSLELVVCAAAATLYLRLDRSRLGLVVGAVVAIGATAFEAALVHLGVFRYLPESDELFGVAPWLLPLYFAASVSVGAIGRKMLSPRASGPA